VQRIALLATLAAMLALAAPASADDYCVTAPGQPVHADCEPADTDSTDLNDAVADANANAGPDRILVGPGTHPDPGASESAAGDQDLVIDGSGRDATFMVVSGQNDELVVVNDPQSVVSDLEIQMGADANLTGIELNGGSLLRVDIAGAPASGTGVRVLEGADATDVDVNLTPSDSTTFGVVVTNSGSATTTLIDVSSRANYGLLAIAGVMIDQDRGVLRGADYGVYLQGNATYVGDSIVARGIESPGVAFAVQDFGSGGDSAVDLRHATLWSHRTGQALNIYSYQGHTVDVDVTDSVMESGATAETGDITVVAGNSGSVASLDLAYSSWRRADLLQEGFNGGSVTVTEGPGNVTDVDHRFVRPGAGDFRIFGDSPLVDAGEPGPLRVDESPFDYLGGARLLDGDGDAVERRDIGAEEFDPADPPPEPPADDSGDGSGDDGGGAAPPPVQPPVGPPAGPPVVVPPPALQPLSLRVGNRRLDRRGRVTFVIGCPASASAPGPCAGRVRLRTARGRVLTLGRRAFTIAPGRMARVRVKVGRRGRLALRRTRRLRVRVTATATNASPKQIAFTLRPRRRAT
jgi:hypothetical protein